MGKEKKDTQFYTENYKNLFNFLQNNLDTLDSETQNMIKGYLESYKSVFKGNKDAIDYLLKNNAELAKLFKELDDALGKIHNELKSIDAQTTKLLTDSGKSKEELNKAIAAYKEINKLNEENETIKESLIEKDKVIAEKQELLEKNSLILSETYKKQLQSEIIDLEKSKKILKDKYTLNEQNIKNNEKLKNGFSNSDLKKEIENEEKKVKLQQKYVNLLGDANKLQDDAAESLEQHTKNIGAFTSVAKAAGQAILTVAKAGFEKWKEIDEKVFTVGRQIGLSSTQLRGYQENVLSNYDKLASKLGMTFDELFKFQESYAKNTGRAIVLTNDQVSSLGAMSKLVGDVATNDMVKNMDDFGASTQTATSYLALNMARARSQGLDAQKASEAFSKNVKLAASHNFREGVNGISKMTLLSQKLKFNMDSIANAADKFETIEGAIGTSANLQMLGGSFATQFGNPLEAMNMAMLDMEGFTNKIVDTFSGKATFNRETGQVEMSAIDKRLMKEAAKQLGISYEEAWNMASQQAKIGDIERQIGLNTESFSKEEKDFITSKTQYDATTQQHYVTYYVDGKEQRVDVKDLSKDQLDIMRSSKDVEHAMYSDIHGIHSILQKYVGEEASASKSFNEAQKGMQESVAINVANMEDWALDTIKDGLKWMSDRNWWIAYLGLTAGGQIVGNLIGNFVGGLFEYGANWLGGKISKKFGGFSFKDLFSGSKKGSSGSSTPKPGRLTPKRALAKARNSTKRFGGKAIKAISNLPGWGKAIGIGTALIGGGMALSSSADGSQIDSSKLGGREVEPNDINQNEVNQTNVEKSQELTELQKHTALLKVIAEKQGVDTTKIFDNTSVSKTNVDNNSTFVDSVDSTISTVGGTTLMAAQTKVGKKGLASVGKKLAGKSVAKSLVKGVPKGGALGLGSLAVDGLNMGGQALGLWEEGSHTDKLMNIGSKSLEYAGYGALIGSIVPVIGNGVGAAVGAAIGGVVGTFQQYGDEIKAFGSKIYNGVKEGLFGEDNMTEADKMQQSYEETKMGIVDIRDPQLEQKAQLATCKIHDIVISMWHHMNGKQSNGLEEDNGLLGNIGNNVVNAVTSPFKLVGSIFGAFSKPSSKETSIKAQYDMSSNVISKPTAGEYQYIRPTADVQSPSYNGMMNNKLDLNVNGTIKLTTDRGSSADIDLNKLLKNTSFMNQLIDTISSELNKRGNFGVSKDKNAAASIMGGATSRSGLNAN